MTAKEYLQQIRKDDIKINQIVKEIHDARERIIFISGIDYTKDRIQTSPEDTSGAMKAVEKWYDLEIKLEKQIDYFVNEKQKIVGEIQGMEKQEHIEILYKRYFEYDKQSEHMDIKSFEQIACEINLSYIRTIHLHGEALKAFSKKYLEN